MTDGAAERTRASDTEPEVDQPGLRELRKVLRLRGRTHVGATLLEVLAGYVEALHEANGRLYLSGLSQQVCDEIVRTAKLDLSGPVQAYQVTPIVGQSTREALADARAWLVALRTDTSGDGTAPGGRR